MKHTTITLPIGLDEILPVERWAWAREGKGPWSRSRCYVCGYGSLDADHSQCNKHFDAAKANGTFP